MERENGCKCPNEPGPGVLVFLLQVGGFCLTHGHILGAE